jgi:hypothetical protein
MSTTSSKQGARGDVMSAIGALRSNRKKAIATLNFDAAERAEIEIVDLHEAEKERKLEELFSKFEPEIVDVAERSEDANFDIETAAAAKLKAIQLKYHTFFKDLKKKQIAALAKLESQYSDSRIRENDRRVPAQLDLLEQAKKAALAGEYATANKLRTQSREVANRTLDERLKALDEEFELNRERTLMEQRDVAIDMANRFAAELATLDADTHSKKAENAKRRATQLLASYQEYRLNLTKIAKKQAPASKARRALAPADNTDKSGRKPAVGQGDLAVAYAVKLSRTLTDMCERYQFPPPPLPA